jgi:renalase
VVGSTVSAGSMEAMNPGVVVVGAGLAGIAAARTLRAAGVEVRVLDRGHRVGGRMASRRYGDRVADIGASYFTVSDPAFEAVAEDWRRRGLARGWTDTFAVSAGGALSAKTGPLRWAAPGGLRSLVEDLAVGLDVREQTVARIGPGPTVDDEPVAAVLLAMPDPQARRLLDDSFEAERAALDDPFEPVLALTARWSERRWPDLDGVFVSENPALTWIADDGRRRGDGAPVLVAHSSAAFAAEHLDAPDRASAALVVALRAALAVDADPVATSVHRWTYAKPTGTRDEAFHLGPDLVGLCGDSWSDRPRVESAYLSGVAAAEELVRRLV